MQEQLLWFTALMFGIFWTLTLQASLNSATIYIIRSVVVIGYSFMVMPYERPLITIAEWAANAMVWSHWFSMVNVFFFPDPRFQKRDYVN
jgi:hypothetical protein